MVPSIGLPFLEKPDLRLFTGNDSALRTTLQQLIDLGERPSVEDLTRTDYFLRTLQEILLFRKDATFYGLGFDNKINEIVDLINQVNISDTPSITLLVLRPRLITALEGLKTQGENTLVRPLLNDILYFEYARNGENALNQEVSRLGDALVLLSEVSKELNRIEGLLAINPGKRFLNERGELIITDNAAAKATASDIPLISSGNSHFFYNTPSFATVERKYMNGTLTRLNAIEVLQDSFVRLSQLAHQIPAGSDQLKSLQKIINMASNEYNISSWNHNADSSWADRLGGSEEKGELFWKTNFSDSTNQPKNFARLYMDSEFRKSVSDALSVVQSQNDIQKQILSKSLFLYQEFIKSSSSLLDMTFKCSKSIAQKIAR